MFTLALQDALLFSIKCIFDIYISIVLFRLILQFAKADFYNPIAEFVVRITNPLLKPLRKVIPGFFGIDWSAILLAIILQVTELILILLVKGFALTLHLSSFLGILLWGLGELLDSYLLILLIVVFLRAIMSWIQPGIYSPGTAMLIQITEPMYRKVRKFLPDLGAIDLSPVIIIFIIILIRIIFPVYLIGIGRSLF